MKNKIERFNIVCPGDHASRVVNVLKSFGILTNVEYSNAFYPAYSIKIEATNILLQDRTSATMQFCYGEMFPSNEGEFIAMPLRYERYEGCDSIIICFNPNQTKSFEQAKKLYDTIQTYKHMQKNIPIFLVGCCDAKELQIVNEAKQFAGENNLCFYTYQETDSLAEKLIKFVSDKEFNLNYPNWHALSKSEINKSFETAKKQYIAASNRTNLLTFFSFGLIDSAEQICSRRKSYLINNMSYFYSLVLFLQSEKELDLNSLNYFVLKNLFPNLSVNTTEDLQAFISCLTEKLMATPQFQNIYKSILFILIIKNHSQEFLPHEITKLIIDFVNLDTIISQSEEKLPLEFK